MEQVTCFCRSNEYNNNKQQTISSKGIQESIILLLLTLVQFSTIITTLIISVIINNSSNTVLRTTVEYEFNPRFIYTVFVISDHQSGHRIQAVLFSMKYNVYSFVFQLILGHILQQDLNLHQVSEFVIDIVDANIFCSEAMCKRTDSYMSNVFLFDNNVLSFSSSFGIETDLIDNITTIFVRYYNNVQEIVTRSFEYSEVLFKHIGTKTINDDHYRLKTVDFEYCTNEHDISNDIFEDLQHIDDTFYIPFDRSVGMCAKSGARLVTNHVFDLFPLAIDF